MKGYSMVARPNYDPDGFGIIWALISLVVLYYTILYSIIWA